MIAAKPIQMPNYDLDNGSLNGYHNSLLTSNGNSAASLPSYFYNNGTNNGNHNSANSLINSNGTSTIDCKPAITANGSAGSNALNSSLAGSQNNKTFWSANNTNGSFDTSAAANQSDLQAAANNWANGLAAQQNSNNLSQTSTLSQHPNNQQHSIMNNQHNQSAAAAVAAQQNVVANLANASSAWYGNGSTIYPWMALAGKQSVFIEDSSSNQVFECLTDSVLVMFQESFIQLGAYNVSPRHIL